MLKLKKILAEHYRFSPKNTLKNNLGDGYLLKKNSVYRKVRERALRFGFRFNKERFYDYDALALTQLPKILSKKTIPYCDNVRPLLEVEKVIPGHFSWQEVPPLRANTLLHESAHAIAHTLIQKNLSSSKNDREKVLRILIEESFANACESFANLESKNTLHDEFLHKNSYIMETQEKRNQLSQAILLVGKEVTFRILFFSFLHANFLRTKSVNRNFERVLAIALFDQPLRFPALTPANQLILKKAFRVGFDLDPEFTLSTNAFCLRLLGFKKPLKTLLDFDFLSFFEENQAYLKALAFFSEITKC